MISRMGYWASLTVILMSLLQGSLGQDDPQHPRFHVKETFDAHLFEPSEQIRVLAPTVFPKPTDKRPGVVPIVQPTMGRHRAHCDAVLAYAEGYKLPVYMMFLETLRETGFKGDVVLAIADRTIVRDQVTEYLSTLVLADDTEDDQQMHVVVYQQALDCDPKDGKPGRFIAPRTGDTDPFQMCRLDHVYGWPDSGETVPDPRSGRVVATLRYEWYWIWSLRYNANSWLMLLDSRDSFFQADPFANLPRRKDAETTTEGLLYLFGENAEATRLGISTKNRRWIQVGYGDQTMNALKDKPTICSGSTMGEQIAIETYLRAMVNEHDEANVRMTGTYLEKILSVCSRHYVDIGSDQGFHNYLYYSGKLRHAATIQRIVVWEQGRGVVNNLGALRTKPLSDWGMYDSDNHIVYQWDGVTPSPVVHQFDRDNDLGRWMGNLRHKQWANEWKERRQSVSLQ